MADLRHSGPFFRRAFLYRLPLNRVYVHGLWGQAQTNGAVDDGESRSMDNGVGCRCLLWFQFPRS